MVELEESKIKPGFNTSQKLLDNIMGDFSNDYGIGYDNSIAKEYIDKVVSRKIMKNVYLPFIFGGQAFKQNEDANDYMDYNGLASYYKNVKMTNYTTYVKTNYDAVRFFDNIVGYGECASIIGTATNYISSQGDKLNGFWGFIPETGLIYSAYFWHSNLLNARKILIQPIIP